MAKLETDVRAYIVQCLACFDTPTIVVEAVKKEFGIVVVRQRVESHNPERKAGERLGKQWKKLFYDSRESFLEDTKDIAISHRSVRLRRLERMAEVAEGMNNIVLSASLMEQAAKEMGEAFTNRRSVDMSNKDGTLRTPPTQVRLVVGEAVGSGSST